MADPLPDGDRSIAEGIGAGEWSFAGCGYGATSGAVASAGDFKVEDAARVGAEDAAVERISTGGGDVDGVLKPFTRLGRAEHMPHLTEECEVLRQLMVLAAPEVVEQLIYHQEQTMIGELLVERRHHLLKGALIIGDLTSIGEGKANTQCV